MPQPQPLEIGKGKTVMLHGFPGVGKTRYIVGGCPDCLIIRPPQDNTDSIPPEANCEELVASDWVTMFEIFAWLQQGGHKKYKWVWLDSISLMQDELLDDVLTDMLMRRPDLAMDKAGEGGDTTKRWHELAKSGIKIPEFGADKGDYKVNFDRLAKWCRDMIGIAKAGAFNFGITAHPFERYDPVKKKDEWVPWIQGKGMINKICGYMNIICYLQENKTEDGNQRVLLTDSDGFMGKDQLHCFPELKSGRHGIIDPTGAKLVKAIKSSKVAPPADEAAPKRRPAKRKVVRRKK